MTGIRSAEGTKMKQQQKSMQKCMLLEKVVSLLLDAGPHFFCSNNKAVRLTKPGSCTCIHFSTETMANDQTSALKSFRQEQLCKALRGSDVGLMSKILRLCSKDGLGCSDTLSSRQRQGEQIFFS